MNDNDIRRLLEDLGREEPPPPDDDFLDQLEYQLRAEVIANAPSPALAGAPWRLPFGIAAAAFTVVVGVAGVSVVKDLPNRQVSAQLASVAGDAEVIYPNGKVYKAREGMTIPEGSVVIVPDGGSAVIDGKPVGEGQAVKLQGDGSLAILDEDELAEVQSGQSDQFVAPSPRDPDGPSYEVIIPEGPGRHLPMTVPESAAATPTTEAGRRTQTRVDPSPLGGGQVPVGQQQQSTTNSNPNPSTSVAPPPQSIVVTTQPVPPETQVSDTPTTLTPTTDTTIPTTAQPPTTTETTVPPPPTTDAPPPPGGTTTTTTPPDTNPSGGTDPGDGGPGDTVVPAGSTGGDEQAADDGLEPAGEVDGDQSAAGAAGAGEGSATDRGATSGGDTAGGSADDAGNAAEA